MISNKKAWAERHAAGLNKFDVANQVAVKAVQAEFEAGREKFDAEEARKNRRAEIANGQADRAAKTAAKKAKADEAEAETIESEKG